MPTLAEVYDRAFELGRNPKWNGQGFSCDCGACGDTKRHLYVGEGDKVAITLHCKHGCEPAACAAGLGYELCELSRTALAQVSLHETIYPFYDEQGTLLFEEVRRSFKDGSKAKLRQPDATDPSGYRWTTAGVRWVPYNLPEVTRAKPGDTLLWPEGLKDVETCRRAGFCAVSPANGTSGNIPKTIEFLPAGVRIGVLQDYDRPGVEFAAKKLAALKAASFEALLVELPGLEVIPEHGKDISDWMGTHTPSELRALVKGAFEPPPDPWEAPVPLVAAELPEFPLDAYPSWLSGMVEAVAEATQTPVDVAALLALSVLSTAVAQRVEAEPFPGWREVLVVWVLAALESGNLKSPVYNELIAPIVAYEAELTRLTRDEVAEDELWRESTKGQIQALKTVMVKGSEFERREAIKTAGKLTAEMEARPVRKPPRLIADDVTQERLAEMMAEQGGRMAIMSPEGNSFEIMAGRYSGGPVNLGIYKHGHSGDRVVQDRLGRPPVVIDRPALTVGITVQPGVIARFGEQPQFREQGILSRFLYVLPKSLMGRRDVKASPVPEPVRRLYHAMVGKLLLLSAEPGPGTPKAHTLYFSPAAQEAVTWFRAWLEPDLAEGAGLDEIRDWAGKLHGSLVRVASLVHLANRAGEPTPYSAPVDEAAVHGSQAICSYLIPHARAALRLVGQDNLYMRAQKVLLYLARQQKPTVTARDLQRGLGWLFPKQDLLEPVLSLLLDRGYLRPMAPAAKAGRPSAGFEVHPSVLEEKR